MNIYIIFYDILKENQKLHIETGFVNDFMLFVIVN
ncbi:MAG: hypothetical protein ACI9K4_001090 [Polaribacter sp.]